MNKKVVHKFWQKMFFPCFGNWNCLVVPNHNIQKYKNCVVKKECEKAFWERQTERQRCH